MNFCVLYKYSDVVENRCAYVFIITSYDSGITSVFVIISLSGAFYFTGTGKNIIDISALN